jgi:hypothetical protein
MTAQEVILISALFFGSMNADAADKQAEPTHERLVAAIEKVESIGNVYAVRNVKNEPLQVGCLQITQICLDDVNKNCKTNYGLEDILGNRELSICVFREYMRLWATPKRLGRPVTDQDRARIWNGGPNGWKRSSTLLYWEKVKKHLHKPAPLHLVTKK